MFEIFKSEKSGEFFFRLKARNSLPILASQGYKTKAACKNGIRSVQKNSTKDAAFNKETAKNKNLYFTVLAKNGEVIAKSQMYKSASGLAKGMASVKTNAAAGEIRDLT